MKLKRIITAVGILLLLIFAVGSIAAGGINQFDYLIIGDGERTSALTVKNMDSNIRNEAFFGNKERKTSGQNAIVVGSGQDNGTWNVDTTQMGNLAIVQAVQAPASGSPNVALSARMRNNSDTDSYVAGQIRIVKQPNSNAVDVVLYAADGVHGYPTDPPQRFRIKGDTGNIGLGTNNPDVWGIGNNFKYLTLLGEYNRGAFLNLVSSGQRSTAVQMGNESTRWASITATPEGYLIFYINESGQGTGLKEAFRVAPDMSVKIGDFKVTKDSLEFKGRVITAEDIDKLLALIK